MNKEKSTKADELTFPFDSKEWQYIMQMSQSVQISGEMAVFHAEVQKKMQIVAKGLSSGFDKG